MTPMTISPGSAYALRLRDAVGTVRPAVVTASTRTGPAGHRVFADSDGALQVEIACTGEHRILRSARGLRIISAACLS